MIDPPPIHFPRRSRRIKLQRLLHQIIDPLLSFPHRRSAAARLRGLPDGTYSVPVTVPYVPQFATPALINDYIHNGLHGRDDPNWRQFGAADADSYTFWAHRVCAIACLKMAIDAYHSAPAESLWALTQAGVDLGGYLVRDGAGNFVDMGWLYPGLVKLAEQRGLQIRGLAYASVLDVCACVRDGWIVAAAVTPELGEPPRSPHHRIRRYDGHFVICYGFTWQSGRVTHLHLHNPSGRSAELQAGAVIHARRFGAAFAHRFIALRGIE
jgi:hypothetical protein